MPDTVGVPLDQAQAAIRDAGYEGRIKVGGAGVFDVPDESSWQVCYQIPSAGRRATALVLLEVEHECDDGGVVTTFEEANSQPPAPPPEYQGPDYVIETIDPQEESPYVDHYWVLTDQLDYSTPDYHDQVKLIIADVIRNTGNAQMVIQVVTDPEIIEAESAATSTYFKESIEPGYWDDVMVPKEESHWVARYSGGVDDTGELTYADDTYTVDWWPAGDTESELWKPEIAD